jgi:hypothetical protein
MANAHHTRNLERPPLVIDSLAPPVLEAPKMPLAFECVGCGNEAETAAMPCPKCGGGAWTRIPRQGYSAALALLKMPADGINTHRHGTAAGKGSQA